MSFIDWDWLNEANELDHNLKLVEQLNKLFVIDPDLTKTLVNTRHTVSKAYTEADEFIYQQEGDEDPPVAGLIGVLSGLALDTNKYRIAANYNDDNELTGFYLIKIVDGKFTRA